MWNPWGLYVRFHSGGAFLLAALSCICTIYLVVRRHKAGEWAFASATGASLFVFGLSMYLGLLVIIGSFRSIALTGMGGVGSVGAGLAESRAAVLFGATLSSIVILIAFVSDRFSPEDAPPVPPANNVHRILAFWSTFFCILLVGLMIIADFSLPNFLMDSMIGKTELSMTETTQWTATRIVSLKLLSVIAMIVGIGLLLLPILLKRSQFASKEISLKIPSMLVLLLLMVQIGIISHQGNFFYQIAMTGEYPGVKISQKPLSREDKMRMLPARPGALDLGEPIRTGDREMVLELLKRGANPNDDSDIFLGQTPLMYAVHQGQSEIVFDLIQAGADVNAHGSKGKTALMQAALSDQTSILKILLDAGANPNVRDESGFTALTSAVSMGNLEAVQALIGHGANPNSVDAYGISVLQVAQASDRHDIVDALIKGGAKP
jgi:hypothetical protein